MYATGRLFVDKHFQEDKKHMVMLTHTLLLFVDSLKNIPAFPFFPIQKTIGIQTFACHRIKYKEY